MSSPQSGPLGYTESLATKMDRLTEALCGSRAALREGGVYVDVYANGQVRAITIDDEAIASAAHLGPLIVDLINRAREQAQEQVEQLVREVEHDPRVAGVVEQIRDAPERGLPPAPQGTEGWDEEGDDPWRPRSRIAAD
ncbi:YbaB/EbfC family nucleoid-associated protein [Nocardia sp. NPDC020380]|uniref:YbaB/EbfC family nucleoid-associated protein n=1 Tax=Nocardia sp. NPDC020380 TaxID=3364309 RepID=UPI0037B0A05D